MTSLSILLVVIASVLHVSRDFMTKKVQDKQVFIWWFSWISLLALAPFAIFLIVKNPIPLEAWLFAASAGLVHSSYWVAYSKAYESKDFSQVYPIIRSSPLLVLLFAILIFHEQITALGLIGILTISLGVYFITKNPSEKNTKKEGLGFAFLGMSLAAGTALIDKVAISTIHPIVFAFTMSIFANLYFTAYLCLRKEPFCPRQTWTKNRRAILLNSFTSIFNYPLILFALTLSPVSYVTSFRQISVLLATLAGGYLLKEKDRRLRIFASLVIMAGAVMISFG